MKSDSTKKQKPTKQAKSDLRPPDVPNFIKALKQSVISEIKAMPDNVFMEELKFATFVEDDKALEKYLKENKIDDIQWLLSGLDIKAITKRAHNKLKKIKRKTVK